MYVCMYECLSMLKYAYKLSMLKYVCMNARKLSMYVSMLISSEYMIISYVCIPWHSDM